jgi:hypothetical protein
MGHYVVSAPSVVSEVIDGEAVILKLSSGTYYSTDECGAFVWSWIQEGRSLASIIELAGQRFSGDSDDIDHGITAFVGELLEQELIRPAESGNGAVERPSAGIETPNARRTFVAPLLQVYDDMQGLLLIDPIHEVGETGWPSVIKEGAPVDSPDWPTAGAEKDR